MYLAESAVTPRLYAESGLFMATAARSFQSSNLRRAILFIGESHIARVKSFMSDPLLAFNDG